MAPVLANVLRLLITPSPAPNWRIDNACSRNPDPVGGLSLVALELCRGDPAARQGQAMLHMPCRLAALQEERQVTLTTSMANCGEYRQAAGAAGGRLIRIKANPLAVMSIARWRGGTDYGLFRSASNRSLGRANLRPGLSNLFIRPSCSPNTRRGPTCRSYCALDNSKPGFGRVAAGLCRRRAL